jgi:hypothetical protein
LLPVVYDLQRYARAGAPPPLADRLRAALQDTSVRVVDLLPAMAASGTPPEDFFLPCDYHWSAVGHAIAARLAQRSLSGALYPARSTTPPPSG